MEVVFSPCALKKVEQVGLTPVCIATDEEARRVARHAHAPFRRGLHVSGDGHAEVGGHQAGHNSAEGCRRRYWQNVLGKKTDESTLKGLVGKQHWKGRRRRYTGTLPGGVDAAVD